MKKKALVVATVGGFVPQFEMNNVKLLQELGYEVHYASNFKNPHYGPDNRRLEGTGIVCHQVDFVRSPFQIPQNIRAYCQLCRLMEGISFSLVHCHTPMGGALGRLAAEKVRWGKQGKCRGRYPAAKRQGKEAQRYQREEGCGGREAARVIYTAHGFHFYKGAPLINWLLYYPVECLLAHWTDALVTINQEDYRRAKKLGAKKVYYVPGVGLDIRKFSCQGGIKEFSCRGETRKFSRQGETREFSHQEKSFHEETRQKKRRELGMGEGDYILLSVGELSKRKNHSVVVEALAKLKGLERPEKMARIHFFICGQGSEEGNLRSLAGKLGVSDHVHFLGYREDVVELYSCSDLFLFMSLQEGLPVALMEAMACGLPAICSGIRGNVDLVEDGVSGCIVENSPDGVAGAIKRLLYGEEERKRYSEAARRRVQRYSLARTLPKMERIYQEAGVL